MVINSVPAQRSFPRGKSTAPNDRPEPRPSRIKKAGTASKVHWENIERFQSSRMIELSINFPKIRVKMHVFEKTSQFKDKKNNFFYHFDLEYAVFNLKLHLGKTTKYVIWQLHKKKFSPDVRPMGNINAIFFFPLPLFAAAVVLALDFAM